MKILKTASGCFLALAVLLAGAPAAPAGAEVLTGTSIVTDGLEFLHPCTMEPLALSGRLHLQAVTSQNGGNTMVGLRMNSQWVTATEKDTQRRYGNSDIFSTTLNMGPLPSERSVVAKVVFGGLGQDRFRANVWLHLAVDSNGAATASLGTIRLECL